MLMNYNQSIQPPPPRLLTPPPPGFLQMTGSHFMERGGGIREGPISYDMEILPLVQIHGLQASCMVLLANDVVPLSVLELRLTRRPFALLPLASASSIISMRLFWPPEHRKWHKDFRPCAQHEICIAIMEYLPKSTALFECVDMHISCNVYLLFMFIHSADIRMLHADPTAPLSQDAELSYQPTIFLRLGVLRR